jgi:hypothetical protein
VDFSIPENHYPLEKDGRVQWFSSPYEDTVLIKTRYPSIFIEEVSLWHIILTPVLTENEWTWFKVSQRDDPEWIMFRWQLDRMLIAVCNAHPDSEVEWT